MTLAYFDCFSGAGGDMIVAALVDAGADADAVTHGLADLGLPMKVSFETVTRKGIGGTRFVVEVCAHEHHHHRHLDDILNLIAKACLPPRAAARACDIFNRLAVAEATIHKTQPEHVHFHEVGAIDSIADIVGACLALETLDIDELVCGPLPLGSGTVECEHGILPVPAPATAALLKGFAVTREETGVEMTTPTAAAIFTTLARSAAMPAMRVEAVGYGAGTREHGAVANLLRVFVGRRDADGQVDSLTELAANIDDCSGQIIGATLEKLIAAGCHDAWAAPITMKKSRPAWMLCVLCSDDDVPRMEAILFSETTTLGIRRRPCRRRKLLRRHETVETPYGPIRVKIGSSETGDLTCQPEFADCRTAADAHHVSLREVIQAAVIAQRGKQL
ncbi:MAG: nickel pincer cofactor biosynthesis protein LarC [Planctomycetaceae bacterium]|nr:nickel pincer cofactor biosynthesis protein LarC [Planctomycetaceae bacterium]